jgi:hypothetical protein
MAKSYVKKNFSKKFKLDISSPKHFSRLASAYKEKPFYNCIKTGAKV